MSWLSKTAKSVASNPFVAALNPIGYVTTDMGLNALGQGGLDGIMKGKPGPTNPFNPADKSRLFDLSGIDYLKDDSSYNYLKDPSQFDFLKSGGPSFASTYKAPARASDAMFQDYLSQIQAPSSVDQVQSGVDSDLMRSLLEGADTDTRNSVGSLKSDFADRGLGGPGMISDIEGNALAQAYATGDKTKASARTDFATKELARMKAKEDAANEAYKGRYAAGVGFDTQDADIASKGVQSDLDRLQRGQLSYADLLQKGNQGYADAKTSRDSLFAQLLNARDLGAYNIASNDYNAAAEREQKYKEPSLFDKLLGSINIGI